MDPLTAFLDGPRARSAFLIRTVMDGPFAMRIEDHCPAHGAVREPGSVVVSHARRRTAAVGGGAVELEEGDIALVRGPEPYVVGDAPDTAPTIVIREGQVCETLAGEPLAARMGLGVRTWGSSADGATVMLTGTYEHGGALERRPCSTCFRPWSCCGPSSGPVRSCPSSPTRSCGTSPARGRARPSARPDHRVRPAHLVGHRRRRAGWFAAGDDPVVGPTLRALHADPAEPWTVDSLARVAHGRRASLARRFTLLVGETPIGYLTGVRLALAADLLRDPGAKVARWRHASVTPTRSRSAPRSSGPTATARASTAPAPPEARPPGQSPSSRSAVTSRAR